MPDTRGLVSCVLVGDDYGFTTIVVPTNLGGINNQNEHFMLWFGGVSTPDEPNLRATHDRWQALLRDAMANGFHVTIAHEQSSSVALSVHLG